MSMVSGTNRLSPMEVILQEKEKTDLLRIFLLIYAQIDYILIKITSDIAYSKNNLNLWLVV